MKLEKVNFLDASESQELTKEEQKLIFGGYSGDECCWWKSGTDSGCSNAAGAYHMGGTLSLGM
ncbi:hypothetical protein NXY11_26605 [Parabacteroides faecis]|uniref:hypothetical protein n=1 Tax=Parabacteroides faecis TaxID=1217282 RepID=UPI0021642B05|nr:hypothetical protein [Parabacteroides faecis]UVQ46642.1 hypothetical protein NXY11_26605 [Parabacteroides faecis]